jgi:hypothetical protein
VIYLYSDAISYLRLLWSYNVPRKCITH